MICETCGSRNNAKFKFCDSCGAVLQHKADPSAGTSSETSGAATTNSPEPSTKKSLAEQIPMHSHQNHELNLTTLAGFRWLFATDYGRLTITENLLNHQMHKLWAKDWYSLVVKIFSWGFDVPTSLFVTNGSTSLKEINTVRVFAVNWFAWKGHFIFIWSGGWPDIYWFSVKQKGEVESFLVALTNSIAQAKYQSKN